MATRDWSLVVFTLLTQAAVGAFLTLQVLDFLRSAGRPHGRSWLVPHAAVLAALAVGLFAALFHLSTPLQAASAVVNFSSSWLSREIVFGGLFAVLLAALVATEWQVVGPRGASGTNRWLPWLTAAAGLAFLYCQTAIYLLPAQPAWNSFATPAAFGGSALRLGILGVAAGLVLQGPPAGADRSEADPSVSSGPPSWGPFSWQALRGLALAAVVVLGAEFLVLPFHLLSLAADGSPAAAASATRLTSDYGGLLVLRLALLGTAALALGAVFATRRPARPRLATSVTGAAFCLVLASELCGRFLFYAMQVRVGI